MADQRIESVTAMLRQMRDLSGKLHEILAPEIMSYEIIQGDLQLKRDQMKQIDAQKLLANAEIEQAKKSAQSIKDMAKEEASNLMETGKSIMIENLNKSKKLLKDVEEFVKEMDKKRYMGMVKEQKELEKV